MDWLLITQALFFSAMMIFLFPSVKHALKNPSESSGKWSSVLVPLLMVIIIVVVLISLVR